jgi:hypothetical protein
MNHLTLLSVYLLLENILFVDEELAVLMHLACFLFIPTIVLILVNLV